MLLMMMSACSSSDSEGGQEGGVGKKPAMLAVYVYSPERAAAARQAEVTRGDVGQVDAINNEGIIKSLQLWIYESSTGNPVGHLSTTDVTALNTGEGMTYQIPVSDEFAAAKPDVDVYVQANVTAENCGVGELNEETTRAALLTNAKITTDHFGLGSLVTSVPKQGLPMAGMLTVQPVVGDAPALRVGSMSQVSTVPLTRAVSKLRFVFAKTTGQPTVSITSITMHAGMIPEVEYLFDKTQPLTYNENAAVLWSTIDDINETADPTQYIYYNQEAQTYEDQIDAANLTVRGPIYLRESDKRLSGTISYSIGGVAQEPVTFQMQQAGDFLRNHTWIVYAYYAGSGSLQVQTVYVKEWTNKEMSHSVYNW
jgi:hypothetical protein